MLPTFACARCGRCCGDQDLIQLTAYELFTLAGGLGSAPTAFFDRYCMLAATSSNPALHLYLKTHDRRCPFLEGSLCSVYASRPYACRAYPARALRTPAGSMKAFIRERYPELERTCSVFDLPDDALLEGDRELLIDQAIAYAVDEIYINVLRPEKPDLAVPYQVTADLLREEGARAAALEGLARPERSPLQEGRLPGLIALLLQARAWDLPLARVVSSVRARVEEDPRVGRYVHVLAPADAVAALRGLAEAGMAACRTFQAMAGPGNVLLSGICAPAAGPEAIGFQVEISEEELATAVHGCTGQLYLFFLPDDGSSDRAAGLVIGNLAGSTAAEPENLK